MMDVTVKTLDSQTRQFSVPEQITVKEFKERIAGSVNIPASTQRLIFCGRVLQDSKKLSEYEVHGCTIHLVEKPPPSTGSSTSNTSNTSSSSGQHGSGMSDGRDSFFMGAITVQADIGESGNIHVQQPNGSHMDVHINLGPINMAPPVSASQQRVTQIRNLLRQTHLTLERLENPPQQQGTQTDPVAATGSGTPTSSSETASNSSTTTSSSSTTETNQQPSSTGGATPSPDSASNNQAGQGQAGRRTATVVHPRSTVMADILTEIADLNTRLQPHLNQYRELLISDPIFEGDSDRQPAHRLQTLVNQTLHYISHIYHAVSDCMMDLQTTPPRVLRAPAGMMVAPIRPAGQMPVHVNIGQMAQNAASQGAAATTEERPSSTTSSTSQQNASTRTSSTATTQTQNSQAPPLVSNASVTLTNQQTYVITPRSGATGYVAVPVSSSSNQTSGGTPSSSTANQGGGRGTAGSRPTGPRPSGPHVHIHQLGLNPGSIPPAGLLQVMAQMVGQQQMQQMAQTPANHAGPTNTSSTPTTSSPRSQQNAQSTPSPQNPNQNQSRTPNPMAFFNPLQQRPAWDPLLPCNSRHITMRVMPAGLAGRGRAGGTRQNTGSGTGRTDESAGGSPGESGSAGGENANASDGAQNNALPQVIPMSADGSITDVIGGLVNAILNQQPNFVQVVPPGAQQTTQQAASQQQRQQPSQSSSSSSSAAPSGQPEQEEGQGNVLSDQMLMNMMLRMTQEMGSVGTGQSNNQSLRNFLSGMGMALEPGEGFLGELLDEVTAQLGMGDFASMFLGQSAPLQQLRPNLERFVNQRIMRGQPLTPENIEVGVNRILDELQPAVTEFINGAPTVNNIDPVATHMKFLHSVLEKFVRLFAGQEESTFGEQMRSLGHDSLHQWVALMVHIFGSRQSVDEFLSTRMRTWFGVDATPGSLVATMSLQNFDLVHRMLTVTPDQIAHFVVKKQSSSAGAAGPATSSTAAASGSSAKSEPTPDQSQDTLDSVEVIMEAEIHVPDESMNALLGSVGQTNAAQRTPSTEAAATPVPMATSGDAVAMDTSGWEAAVPAEWVPVINQDIGRQRRQAPQGGLSDAYLAGMPPKRMKLTQDKKSPINNGVETFLPGTLRRAVQAVGAQPLTGVDALVRDAEASSSLYDACEEQVRGAVQERLRRDPDYDPQKFPNTDKYVNKKK